MEASFHYRLKVKLLRKSGIDEENPSSITQEIKEYVNQNPIQARNEAFADFKEWIQWLYQGSLTTPYSNSDWQNRIDLKSLFPEDKKEFKNIELDFRNLVDFGISVYLVIDKPIENILPKQFGVEFSDEIKAMSFLNEIGKEYKIHGISLSEPSVDILSDNLSTELEYYDYYNYEKQNQIEIEYFDVEFNQIFHVDVLETPLEWNKHKYDDLQWAHENNEISIPISEINSQNETEFYQNLILSGESNEVEFKPSMLYGFKYGNYFEESKWIIAKTISSFLNKKLNKVGVLFIGLKDNGDITGLEKTDFTLSIKNNVYDYFRLEFDKLVTHYLSNSVISNLELKFIKIEDKTLAVVEITPCKFPVYLLYDSHKNSIIEFYLCAQASCRKLIGIELDNYLIEKFDK